MSELSFPNKNVGFEELAKIESLVLRAREHLARQQKEVEAAQLTYDQMLSEAVQILWAVQPGDRVYVRSRPDGDIVRSRDSADWLVAEVQSVRASELTRPSLEVQYVTNNQLSIGSYLVAAYNWRHLSK